jgi:Holliday junction resolvasome RuvABC endonuclease subunit
MSEMSTVRYLLGLDISLCHTGWALYDQVTNTFAYGVIEPPKDMTEVLPRMDFMRTQVLALMPGTKATWAETTFVTLEGLAFSANGNVALQLAGVGYFVRHALWRLGIKFKDITPNQGKKFLTGKGQSEKNIILKEVFRRYKNQDGSPVDVDDDNIADAVNFNMIGRAMLGWSRCENKAQQEVLADLLAGPKVKKTKKKKGAKSAPVVAAA